jgi:hypothetical protein
VRLLYTKFALYLSFRALTAVSMRLRVSRFHPAANVDATTSSARDQLLLMHQMATLYPCHIEVEQHTTVNDQS